MRWPLISMVSPSITLARPVRGTAGSRAKAAEGRTTERTKAAMRIMRAAYADCE
jgi:hypothetical protein